MVALCSRGWKGRFAGAFGIEGSPRGALATPGVPTVRRRGAGVGFVAVTMVVGFGHTVSCDTLADVRAWRLGAIPADLLVCAAPHRPRVDSERAATRIPRPRTSRT